MNHQRDDLHDILDGAPEGRLPDAELAEYRQVLDRLGRHGQTAPDGFADRVMAALPGRTHRGLLELWPRRGQWVLPAAAGAAAALVLFAFAGLLRRGAAGDGVTVAFELHAPEAERVELIGSFNDWTPGEIVLRGPDATGHWSVDLELAAGRHEYVFLVDGTRWQVDPHAPARRPDGFGHLNAILEL
jgi:hypothetical protein